ncbi:MAG: FtsX-like permease family protein [Anaerolineae bacterium]|nr:FtsX-like permease family protein [Anaerolineae bacterium]
MSVIWRKIWSDLWGHKIRTLLAVLSIAAGVFALGAIFGMIDQLVPNLNRVHGTISPANITMYLRDRITQDTADRLKNIEGVVGVEVLNEMPIRYRLSPDQEWQPGALTMRADYEEQKFNLLQLKAGEWPHRNDIGVDMRAFDSLGLKFGDTVMFELEGSDRALPVTGKIRHHFMTSPDFGDDPRFFVDAQGLERFGVPDGEFNELLVRVEPYTEDLARAIASEIKDRLGKEGVGIGVTYYSKPDEHWAKHFFDGLNLILQLLALVSLFMSVILVYNTLSALITEQTNQIGIMKALGGSTGVIIRVYLAGVLVYGLLALLVSLPLGAWVAFNASRYFLGIFNIDHNTFQLSPSALAVQAAAAVGVPLVAALIPVFRGALITVREAIASYGLGGTFGSNPFDRLVERLGRRFLSAPNAMALSNLFRRKGRLGLTQLVLITAGTLFLMVMTLSNSITLTVNNELARRTYQSAIFFENNQRINRVVRLAESLPGVAKAELRFSQSASLLKTGQRTKEAGVGARLVGIPAGSDMYRPMIVAGRWLQAGDDRAIVINAETAEENDIHVGDMVTLNLGELGDRSWQVIGFYRTVAVVPMPDNIYAPQEAIFRATPKHNIGSQLLVRTVPQDAASVETVTRQLKDLFDGRNWDVEDSQTIHEDRSFFDNFFAQYIPMLLGLAVIMAIVGGIGLMGALSISVAERTKEIGVMRAIGAKTPVIMAMLILEGVLQGVISWLAAVPLSFLLGQPLAVLMGQAMFDIALDYQYHVTAMGIWLAMVVVISILASVMPARNATTISVRESLAYA